MVPFGSPSRLPSTRSKRSVAIDFAGSSAQAESSINAVLSITHSAVYYVLRCLLPEDAPATAGPDAAGDDRRTAGFHRCTRACQHRLRAAMWRPRSASSSVLLRALAQALPERVPAAEFRHHEQPHTIGGVDARTGRPFAYYETIAGGMGAGPGGPMEFLASTRT